ncbi:CoxG family protein [Ramlibacter sp.]|uniref:CoxG family protein n=1 Tax=Ramlibacter sp. TaxID=1917967 RepID=UPI002FCC8616
MEFRVEAAIPRAASEVWAVLVDIPKIAGCIPGCEEVQERVRLADYSAVLKQKLGPFKVALPATIAVQEVREPNWIQAVAAGTERFTGTRIDVTLRMDLRDTTPGHSHMVAECDTQVAGKLASLGYSVIKKKAEENFADFRTRLLKVLEECSDLQATPATGAAPVGAEPHADGTPLSTGA